MNGWFREAGNGGLFSLLLIRERRFYVEALMAVISQPLIRKLTGESMSESRNYSVVSTVTTAARNDAGGVSTARILAKVAVLLLVLLQSLQLVHAQDGETTFKSVRTQFIAALGDPAASSGTGAQTWGLWREDPGPRGVWLNNFEPQLVVSGGVAPANWKFDDNDWWLDENGLIMEKPEFSVPAGKYIVTGDRAKVAMLTIHPLDEKGNQRWELGNGATLYDVTHLPCRTARYTPLDGSDVAACSPASAKTVDFPVTPGGPMPAVEGCHKLDYAVLFIVAEAVDN
jgi:hypothetical protein